MLLVHYYHERRFGYSPCMNGRLHLDTAEGFGILFSHFRYMWGFCVRI
jgi:hypothetical protein